MKIKSLLIALIFAIIPSELLADFNPTAYYTVDEQPMEATDVINDAQAPLFVTFKANPSNLDEGVTPSYEWRFTKEGSEEPFMIRYEEETSFEFVESGSTKVSLYVAYSDSTDAKLISTIKVSISISLLEMPNAFSPNGDGINDIYKAKENHKSIINFHAYIFNRWGQKLYDWTDLNGGWDGTVDQTDLAHDLLYLVGLQVTDEVDGDTLVGIFPQLLGQLLYPVFTAAVHTCPDGGPDIFCIVHLGGGTEQNVLGVATCLDGRLPDILFDSQNIFCNRHADFLFSLSLRASRHTGVAISFKLC